jgi:hypothetical protein
MSGPPRRIRTGGPSATTLLNGGSDTVIHATRPGGEGETPAPVSLEDLAVDDARRGVERARAEVELVREADFGAFVAAVTRLFRAIGFWEAVARSRGIDPTVVAPELAS